MAIRLDTILKVLGIIVAVLLSLSIIVLLFRIAMPPSQPASTTETKSKTSSLWYDPYWNWFNYPYYWFYPRERHHYYHNNYKYSPSTTTTTTTTTPTTTEQTPTTTEPTIALLSIPSLPDIPSDISPEITINTSLTDGIITPVITQSEPLISEPSITPVENIIPNSTQNSEGFENQSNSLPEPWSNITSLPDSV